MGCGPPVGFHATTQEEEEEEEEEKGKYTHKKRIERKRGKEGEGESGDKVAALPLPSKFVSQGSGEREGKRSIPSTAHTVYREGGREQPKGSSSVCFVCYSIAVGRSCAVSSRGNLQPRSLALQCLCLALPLGAKYFSILYTHTE